MQSLTVAELAELLADPAAVSPVHPSDLVVVPVDDERGLDVLADAAPGLGLPRVIVAVAASPELATRCQFADVVLTGDGIDSAASLDAIAATVAKNPVAATTFALLLRTTPATRAEDDAVAAGLVAESGCYSTLLASAEFQRWRANRPTRPDSPNPERVRVTRDGDVLDVVLCRPERRNALDTAMRDALVEALTVALYDDALVVRLSGDGPAFCAGGDLDEFGSFGDPAQAHLIRLARNVGWLVHRLAARTDVFLHGACMGSGIEIPAFAATVHAAAQTTIGLPEISMGLIPGAGGTVSIPRRVGRQRTAFLGLSGLTIDATTAMRWGLVDQLPD